MPERSRARAKIAPAPGAMVEERSRIAKRSAFEVSSSGRLERLAPATMRIAELIKRAKVKSEIVSFQMENVRQDCMARSEGL